jgi:hypothetical protein
MCSSISRLAFALLLFAAPAAHADSAADLETARLLFREGNELRDKGDLRAALNKYKAAHAMVYTPITGLEVGRTHLALGELVEAREAFLAVGRLPVRAQESKNAAAARVEADRLADAIGPRIPTLRIEIVGVEPGVAPTLSIDDQSLSSYSPGEPRKMNPGPHHLAVRAPGMVDATAEVTLAEREEKSVTLRLAPIAKSKPAKEAAPVATVVHRTSPLVYVGFGVATAAVVTGAVTGILAYSRAQSLDCPSHACGPSQYDDLHATHTFGTISTVSFIVAGASATLGVVGLLSPRIVETKAGVSAHLNVGLGTFALTGTFL